MPQTLKAAIEQKLKQEQEALEYDFKIQKAIKEAERKEIEANSKKEEIPSLNVVLRFSVLAARAQQCRVSGHKKILI